MKGKTLVVDIDELLVLIHIQLEMMVVHVVQENYAPQEMFTSVGAQFHKLKAMSSDDM